MGKLVDPEFWRRTLDALWNVRPVQGQMMSDDDTKAFLTTMCRALSDVLKDPDYRMDLETIEKAYRASPEDFPNKCTALELRKFVDECVEFERALLMQSKFSESQSLAILTGIHDVGRYLSKSEFSGQELDRRIGALKTLVCGVETLPPNPPMDPREVVNIAFDTVLGLAAVGVDAYVLVSTGGDPRMWVSIAKGVWDIWKATQSLIRG